MSIYDKASLVLIPSGTKTSKVYSQKPVSGDGDFTFSRSTMATRVNADGNIEKETQNLLLQSNNFNTTWSLTGLTATSGQSGYDGSSDAYLLEATSAVVRLVQTNTNGGVQTFSIYAKAGNVDLIRFQTQNGGTDAFFNLDTGAVGYTDAGVIEAKMEDVGSGWYRCSMAFNETLAEIRILPQRSQFSVVSGDNIYIQDAQLEQGLVARDYIETTTSAVEGGITDNVPRLDYTDSSCPALLLEPQRTNLVTQSEYLSAWTQNNISVTDNDSISPEGIQNASALVGDGSSSYHWIQRDSGSGTSGTTYTASFFAKKGSVNFVQLVLDSSVFGIMHQNFDLENGTIGSGSGSTTPFIEDYGNGWYRMGVTASATSTATIKPLIALANSNTMGRFGSFATSGDIKIFGVQVEAGSYATSYIPTYGTSVTRNADFSSNNDIVDTPIAIGANDDFALYYEGSFDKDGRNEMMMGGGVVGAAADSKCYWWVRDSSLFLAGNGEVTMASASFTAVKNTHYKILVKRNGSVIDTFVNGTKLSTTQNTTNTAFTFRSLGWSYNNSVYKISGDIKQAMIFLTALTEQEAIDLTTI